MTVDLPPGWKAKNGGHADHLDATRQRMTGHHVAHLLVTTPDGTLLGVVDAAGS